MSPNNFILLGSGHPRLTRTLSGWNAGPAVFLRQNGVGPSKICADAILPKGHG